MGRHLGKRAGALAVAATLLLTAGACGGGDEAGEASGDGEQVGVARQLPPCPVEALEQADGKVEVVVWHFLQARTRDALEQLAADFNASQDKVVVRVENQGTSNDELWSKYVSHARSGDLPPIAILDDTVTQQLIDSDTLLPAQSCIDATDTDMSDYLPGARAYYTVDDVLYPASLNLSGALLYYNRNHFTKAGLDPDKAPQTLDEMRTWAEQLKAAGVVETPVVLQLSPAVIEMFLTGAGQQIVDNDNGRGAGTTANAVFDTDVTVDFFAWAKAMMDDGLMTALPQTPGQIGHYQAMATQSASMSIETSTAATSIEAFVAGDLDTSDLPGEVAQAEVDLDALDIGAAPVPGIDAAGKLAMGGGAWYLTNTVPPEQQAAAWAFIDYVNQPAQQVTWNLIGSYLPYRMSAVEDPRLQAAWRDTLSGRWLAIAYDELLTGVDPNNPGPLIGPYDEFREILRGQIEELIYNGASPEQVTSTAASETTDALVAYNEDHSR